MDALAHYRHSLGLPALSINWGPWEGSTMMDALDTANQNRWSDRGLQYINYHNGFEILQNLISEKVIQACVMPVKWKSFLAQYSDNHIPGFYENFISQSSSPIEKSDFMDQLKGLDIDAQNALLFQHVQKIVSEVMGLNANEKIGSKQRLFDAGMDSLMAITLKNRLEMDLGHSLVPTLVFDYPMITSIVQYIMTDVLSIEKDEEVKEVTPVTYEVKNQTAELDALSEDELASLLMEELG
jgi:acyl carrier protein